jgi:hypothetical protein
MHDAVVLGVVIFQISPVDDERHPIDPLPSNASAMRPEPAAGPISFSIPLVKGDSENIINSSHGVRRATTKTSHETRFVLVRYPAKVLEKKTFSLVGAPGLEPGTR